MLVQIDNREQDLFKKIEFLVQIVPSFKGLVFELKQLPLGDIIIGDGEKELIIIERKSLSDLSASIKDGRYEEQSYRLNGLDTFHNHNVVYMVEGDFKRFNTAMDKLTLYSAMFSLNYYKGFSVVRTFDLTDTATMICNMASKLKRSTDRTAFYSNDRPCLSPFQSPTMSGRALNGEQMEQQQQVQVEPVTNETSCNKNDSKNKEYCAVVKKVKKENVNVNNIGEIMLCQIPGVSSTIAMTVMKQFETLPKLVHCLKEDPSCIDGLSITDPTTLKVRRINKPVLAAIKEYLSC